MNRYRECQPHCHTARVSLHRLIDEFTNLGELFNLGKLRVDLFLRQTKNSGAQINILPSGKFRIEAGAEFQQRRHAPAYVYIALARIQNAGHDLQQSAFAGSVLADNAKRLAALDLETNIVQSRKVVMKRDPVQAG